MIFNRKLVINYTHIYGEKKEISQESLSTLNKQTWAKVLARLNYLARHETNYGIIDVLKDWFGTENNAYANELLHKIIDAYKESNVHPRHLITINIWSNLYLLDKILNIDVNSDKLLNDTNSERELFDIYLAVNGEFGNKTENIFKSVSDLEFPDLIDKLARVQLTNLLPYHDLNHFKATELFVSATIKAYYLFKFLEKEHQGLIDLFIKAYGVASWKDYLKGIIPIYKPEQGDGSGLNYINIKESENPEQSRKFLDHLSLIDEKSYTIKTDFLNARSNPLFKIDGNNYLILDDVLLVNRIYNSVFYELLRLAEKNKDLHRAYNEFFSFYTYEFIEKALSYSLLNKVFGKTKYYQISGEDIVSKYRIDTEPDYYVRNGNKVFLFEVKGSIITGPTKQSFVYTTIETELKEKYLYHNVDKQNKAIAQLAERISILFNGKAIYDEHYNPRNIRVFPILLVTELALTTPGINVVFQQWFEAEIEKDTILKTNRHRINPIIIIDVDTLILYSQLFEEEPGLFEESLLGYINAIDRRKIKPKHGVPATTDYLEQLMFRSYQPYNGFMHDFKRLRTPDLFREFGEDLLK